MSLVEDRSKLNLGSGVVVRVSRLWGVMNFISLGICYTQTKYWGLGLSRQSLDGRILDEPLTLAQIAESSAKHQPLTAEALMARTSVGSAFSSKLIPISLLHRNPALQFHSGEW